ncbi:hypothetical protein B0J17DRAFT_578203 [Rhizoctonia solani]|nr:hypothetical protein B0J17DRAFT_578203 [Rhizoctonia solani]
MTFYYSHLALIEGLPLLTIYIDFLRYIFEHIKDYFPYRALNEPTVWESCHRDMTITPIHPNGWGFKEQSILRQAVIDAGYVSSVQANSNVVFVSEAEASTHFCLFHLDFYNQLEVSPKKYFLSYL